MTEEGVDLCASRCANDSLAAFIIMLAVLFQPSAYGASPQKVVKSSKTQPPEKSVKSFRMPSEPVAMPIPLLKIPRKGDLKEPIVPMPDTNNSTPLADKADGIPAAAQSMATPPPCGNIAPYRRTLLQAIDKAMPTSLRVDFVVLLTIAKDGTVLDVQQVDAPKTLHPNVKSNNDLILALQTLREIKCEPLPAWFRGEKLPFKMHIKLAPESRRSRL